MPDASVAKPSLFPCAIFPSTIDATIFPSFVFGLNPPLAQKPTKVEISTSATAIVTKYARASSMPLANSGLVTDANASTLAGVAHLSSYGV